MSVVITNKNIKNKLKKVVAMTVKTKSGLSFELTKTRNKKILAIDSVLAGL